MKEVEAKRFAGSFDEVPYEYFIQSPVSLVPKVGGKTRLIFNLSYKFDETLTGISLNEGTLRDICTVRYNDLDVANNNCLRISKEALVTGDSEVIFLGKTDLTSAFRVLPCKCKCFCLLILKAEDPAYGKFKYFVDKCLPFGTNISCALYQKFLDVLCYILEKRNKQKGRAITNYLDNFLFAAITEWLCNHMITQFMELCKYLHVPIVVEKTEWASTLVIFLRILLNGETLTLSIPLEKQ